MPFFVNSRGIRISDQTVPVRAGEWTEVGFFEGWPGAPIDVGGDPRVRVTLTRNDGLTRIYRVECDPQSIGIHSIVAKAPAGEIWDKISIQVQTVGLAALVEAGTLVFNNPNDLTAMNDALAHRSNVQFHPELVDLLVALCKQGQVNVMSLIRVGQGPHGVRFTEDQLAAFRGALRTDAEIVCKAVDVAAYCGTPVTLSNKAAAIQVVCNLISHFPTGGYGLGFPRPEAGKSFPDETKKDKNGKPVQHAYFSAAQDVFFPVTNQATADAALNGSAVMGIGQMLQPAQSAVKSAMDTSGSVFPYTGPDGLNHLHIEAARYQL